MMKYTIHGFSQKAAVSFNLDNDDLLLLRWFVDFKNTGKMVSREVDGEIYYWVNYSSIIEILPILYVKKDAVYRKFKKMADLGILKRTTVRLFGTYSFYKLDKNYAELEKFDGKKSTTNSTKNHTTFKETNPIENLQQKSNLEDLYQQDYNFFNETSLNFFEQKSNSFSNCAHFEMTSKPKSELIKSSDMVSKPTDSFECSEQNNNLSKTSKKNKNIIATPEAYRLSNLLFSKIKTINPQHKAPNMDKWAKEFDKILLVDKRDLNYVENIIIWLFKYDKFWQSIISSPYKLRKNYDAIAMKFFTSHGINKHCLINAENPKYDLAGFECINGFE